MTEPAVVGSKRGVVCELLQRSLSWEVKFQPENNIPKHLLLRGNLDVILRSSSLNPGDSTGQGQDQVGLAADHLGVGTDRLQSVGVNQLMTRVLKKES